MDAASVYSTQFGCRCCDQPFAFWFTLLSSRSGLKVEDAFKAREFTAVAVWVHKLLGSAVESVNIRCFGLDVFSFEYFPCLPFSVPASILQKQRETVHNNRIPFSSGTSQFVVAVTEHSSTKRSMFSKVGAKKYTASKGSAWRKSKSPRARPALFD